MKKGSLSILLYFGFTISTVRAQQIPTPSEKKISMDFGGAIGLFIPFQSSSTQNLSQMSLTGSNAMTYLQLNYEDHYFAKLQFGQTTVDYRAQNLIGTVNSSINSKANSTNLGINLGYQRRFGKWQPYVMAGSGSSFIDVPVVNPVPNSTEINFTTASGAYWYLDAGAGTNYKVNKYFIIFLESQLSTIPDIPLKSATHLSGLSALIGIKSPLF